MTTDTRILIVERDTVAAQALQQRLAGRGYAAIISTSADEAIDQLERERSVRSAHPIGVVIADQEVLGPGTAFGLIRRLHDEWPDVVPIVISAFRKVEAAVGVMRLGAADYLLKPVVEQELMDAVQRAEHQHVLLRGYQAPESDQAEDGTSASSSQENGVVDTKHDPAPAVVARIEGADTWTPMPLSEAMKEPERRILLAALEANDWNRQQTAKQLDINRTTLYKKIRQYRLDEPA